MNAFRLIATPAIVLLALCAHASCARADQPGAQPVLLTVPDCLDVHGADVEQLVALELAPRAYVLQGEPQGPVLRASVRCPEGAPVELVVDDPERAAPLRSQLDLARTAVPARTRLLALTLAELIATSRLERQEAAHAGASAAGPAAAPAAAATATKAATTTAAAPAREADEPKPEAPEAHSGNGSGLIRAQSAWRLWLGPGISAAGAPITPLFGADLGVSHGLGPLIGGAALQARWGQANLTDANVALQAFSAALSAAPMFALGAFEFELGPGVRVGYVRFKADARSTDQRGDTLEGAWFGPFGMLATSLGMLGPGAARFALEVGYAARTVVGHDAQTRDLLALRGVWFSSTLAFALSLE